MASRAISRRDRVTAQPLPVGETEAFPPEYGPLLAGAPESILSRWQQVQSRRAEYKAQTERLAEVKAELSQARRSVAAAKALGDSSLLDVASALKGSMAEAHRLVRARQAHAVDDGNRQRAAIKAIGRLPRAEATTWAAEQARRAEDMLEEIAVAIRATIQLVESASEGVAGAEWVALALAGAAPSPRGVLPHADPTGVRGALEVALAGVAMFQQGAVMRTLRSVAGQEPAEPVDASWRGPGERGGDYY